MIKETVSFRFEGTPAPEGTDPANDLIMMVQGCVNNANCHCGWYFEQDIHRGTYLFQHGPNPEHSITISRRAIELSDTCDLGHPLIVEDWIRRTANYVHGEISSD